MNPRLALIVQRRELLITRSELQRAQLGALAEHWRRPLAYVDMGRSVAHAVYRNPVLALTTTAVLLQLPRARLTLWLGRLWTAWSLWRTLRTQWPSGRAG